ncbi:MAG TPA: sigma-70 family RNA polymerase sigma factor [Streptosporangiaceae bacterium]|nr:sigma-70 family RNA polymerase sigma factor [Streptosporangiaceae bacterium]
MRAAWLDLYDAELYPVIRFVMKSGPASLEDARDAAHEAFLESWRLMTTRPGDWAAIRNPRAWLRTVALRRFRRPPGLRNRPMLDTCADLPDASASSLDPGEFTAQAQMVLAALRQLDLEAREVMAYLTDGFPAAAIGEAMGITEQRVRDVIRRARAYLKRWLAAALVDERRQPR